jgi:hypothetical protein
MAEADGNLRSHPWIQALRTVGAPPTTTVLFGYVGEQREQTTRLYLSLDMQAFVDIPNASITHHEELPDNRGTLVWLSRDAEVFLSVTIARKVQADFLGGDAFSGMRGSPSIWPGRDPYPNNSQVCFSFLWFCR